MYTAFIEGEDGTVASAHRVVYKALIDNTIDEETHVSHLCHNPKCCNPRHLVAESPLVNNDRKGCSGIIILTGDGEGVTDCIHNPPCMTVTKGRKIVLPIQGSDLDWCQIITENTKSDNDGFKTE